MSELNVYEVIKTLIGTLPSELYWVYGIATIIFIFILIFLVSYPFIYLFDMFRGH